MGQQLQRSCGIGGGQTNLDKSVEKVKEEVIIREYEREQAVEEKLELISEPKLEEDKPIVTLFAKVTAAHEDYVAANLHSTVKFHKQWAAWYSKYLMRNWTKKVHKKKPPSEKVLTNWLQQLYEREKKKRKLENLNPDTMPGRFARGVTLKLKMSC